MDAGVEDREDLLFGLSGGSVLGGFFRVAALGVALDFMSG